MNIFSFLILTFMTWSVTWGMEPGRTGPAGPHFHQQDSIRESLYRANKNVEQAWQAFHQAALGGTLASPAIQAQIEQALHDSRRLLVDARKAARDNNKPVISALTLKIEVLSTHIKEQSRKRKP